MLEHWFLVLPLPDAALWRWAVPPVNGGGIRNEDTGRQVRRPLWKAGAGRKDAGRAKDQEQRFDSLGLMGRGVPAPGSIE